MRPHKPQLRKEDVFMYTNQNSFETSHRRSPGIVLYLIIIGSLISTSIAVHRESLVVAPQGGSKARISVEDPRPLAKAIEVLEGRYGWVITYEDPRYVYSSEIKDVTLSVRRDLDRFKPGQAPRVLIPKGGRLAFDYDVKSETNLPGNPRTVVQELLKAHAASDNAGRFRLESNDRIMH